MKKYIFVLSLLFFSLHNCSDKTEKDELVGLFELLHKDFKKWYSYHKTSIILALNFTALDENNINISKQNFLKQLKTGDFIALKSNNPDLQPSYKLFKLNETSDDIIRQSIRIMGASAYSHFKFEGKKFPDFQFTILDGNLYTNESVKGNYLLVKCWFINCKPCVEEFPELKRLVDFFDKQKDLIFLSLALDNEDDLKRFLAQNVFNYETVSEQDLYIKEKLHVIAYPTHFIVDRDGMIVKVVNQVSELKMALGDYFILDGLNEITIDNGLPPPPPPIN